MNCFSRLSSYTAFIFGRTSHFIASTRTTNPSHQSRIPFWRRSFEQPGLYLPFISTRFRIQCYSSRKRSLKASVRKKKDSQPTTAMENEKDAFFVVRKGDVVGVYKNFADCEAQLGTSILDPPVSVYKGYSLSKDSEAYLVSHGLQNALYTIRAADLKEDIFGMLTPCPFQQPASSNAEMYQSDANKKRSQEIVGSETKGIDETASTINKHTKLDIQADCQAQTSNSGIDETASTINKHTKLDIQAECQAQTSNSKSCPLEFDGASKGNPGQAGAGAVLQNDDGSLKSCLLEFDGASKGNPGQAGAGAVLRNDDGSLKSCLLEFDGASKGNPGQAGAGAVLRNDDGSLICRLREGLGIATNNMAEYRAVLLGMKCALKKGYRKIYVTGDSKLVCMQIQGSWKAKHENITNLYEEAKKLKNSFLSFHISHVLREYNSEADAQANLAVKLANGEVKEEFQ